jgi:hypothetical protein
VLLAFFLELLVTLCRLEDECRGGSGEVGNEINKFVEISGDNKESVSKRRGCVGDFWGICDVVGGVRVEAGRERMGAGAWATDRLGLAIGGWRL